METPTQPAPLGPPPAEVTYSDIATAKAALWSHARKNGFAVSVHSSDARRVIIKCSKSGKYDPKGKDKNVNLSKRRCNTGTIKTDCPFRVACYPSDAGGWKVQNVNCDYNHSAVLSISALPQHRSKALSSEQM